MNLEKQQTADLNDRLYEGYYLIQSYQLEDIQAHLDQLAADLPTFDPTDRDYAFAIHCTLSSCFNFIFGKTGQAFEQLAEALQAAKKVRSNKMLTMIYTSLSWHYFLVGAEKNCLAFLNISKQLNEHNKHPLRYISDQFNLAGINMRKHNFNKAIEDLTEILALTEKHGYDSIGLIARNNLLRLKFPYEPMEVIEPQLLALAADAKQGNAFVQAAILDTFGEFYQLNNRWDLAFEQYSLSSNLLRELQAGPIETEAYFHAGNAALRLQNFDEAEKYLNMALDVAIEHDIFMILPECYKALGDLYSETNKENLAIDNYLMHHNMEKKRKNQDFLVGDLEPRGTSDDPELVTDKLLSRIGSDPVTGLLDRTKFLHTLRQLRPALPQRYVVINFRLNDGQDYKPRSITKVLGALGASISAELTENQLACRYTKNDMIIFCPDLDIVDTEALARSIIDSFNNSPDLLIEPWVSALLDIGLIQNKPEHKRAIDTILNLELEMFKDAPVQGGTIKCFL